jgi:hypothetical protein
MEGKRSNAGTATNGHSRKQITHIVGIQQIN